MDRWIKRGVWLLRPLAHRLISTSSFGFRVTRLFQVFCEKGVLSLPWKSSTRTYSVRFQCLIAQHTGYQSSGPLVKKANSNETRTVILR